MFAKRRSLSAAVAATIVLALAAGAFAQGKGKGKAKKAEATADEIAKEMQASAKDTTTNAKDIMGLDSTKLLEVIKFTMFQQAKACQRLAVIGTKDAIPALLAQLRDDRMNVYARTALEAIPDPAVDVALRAIATKLQGRQLVGVIDSIGQRKDAGAVTLLKDLLGNSDKMVASAAAGALGRIGTGEAAAVLTEALGKDSPVKTCIGDAGLACAEALAAAGKKDQALTLYLAVGKAGTPKHQQVAALSGTFRLLGEAEAKELLLKQLRSPEKAFFNLGLATARQLPGAGVTAALVAELDKLPAERQACLLLALGDRKDPVPLAVLLGVSKSAAAPVREAAIRVLSTVNDPAALATLLEAAVGEGDSALVAKEGLKKLSGAEVRTAILGRLANADAKNKAVLFELVGAQGVAEAAPTIREALKDSDKAVRIAALAALAQLIELNDLHLLINPAISITEKEELAAAQDALKTAAQRMADRETCAAKLAESLPTAAKDGQAFLFEILGKVSGKKALETVVASVKVPAMKDPATKVLGDWVNADAADALLDIAKNDEDGKYRVRALRGYIRIARQLQLSDEARLAMFHTAMAAAARDDEKKLALDILSRVPTESSLQLAVSFVGDKALKNDAADAAVKIADKLLTSKPKAVVEAMQKVVDAKVRGKMGPHAEELLEQAKAGAK